MTMRPERAVATTPTSTLRSTTSFTPKTCRVRPGTTRPWSA
jgi:hypothetical protein